ncbi:MAG: hypothetical protein HDR09_00870 [Lachnospiraceae bacterium]|nr:hypothetical protein [Lachnospiraceae bacterium]
MEAVIKSNTEADVKTEQTLMLASRGKQPITVHLRLFRSGDENGMIACIRDEYGDTYFKTGFYDPEYLRREAEEGIITFLIAETDEDGIIGMMILKEFYPKESMCEIASQIFRKKYRGYGLAMPFFEYGMKLLLSRNYSAAFCLPVLFHDVTQRLLYRLGMRATGLIMNVFDMDHITHSYNNGRNRKHSQGIQIRAVGKRDAGVVYLPEQHCAFCRDIYASLGAVFTIATADIRRIPDSEEHEAQDRTERLPIYTEMEYVNDDLQHSLTIDIRRAGSDLVKRITKLHTRYPLQGKQTAVVYINCNDPGAVWAYEVLQEMGYFFTGLKPLCSEREYIVMHHEGEVQIYFEDYWVSGEFANLIGYVETCYKKCRQRRLM